MCLFAMITPSESSTSPQGPTNLHGAEPPTSPLSLTGATTPSVRASVKETSTCDAFLSGPRTITAGYSQIYSFFSIVNSTAMKVIRDGKNSSLSEILPYDVVYYMAGNNTLYAYTDKVSGAYEEAYPLKSNVTSVKVGGKEYTLSTQTAIGKMNTSEGAFELGDRVTLLFGRNGEVIDVVDMSASGNLDIAVLTECYSEVSSDADTNGQIHPNDPITRLDIISVISHALDLGEITDKDLSYMPFVIGEIAPTFMGEFYADNGYVNPHVASFVEMQREVANEMEQVNDKAVVEKVADDFKMVFTPFHGTGYELIPEALKRLGMKHVICVPEQMVIDGDFPTVVSPNPENPEGFYLAVDIAKKEGADFILGSDPDDKYDLGGVIEIGLNGELHRLTRSSVIFMPPGMKHLPLSIIELHRPILHFSVSMNPTYTLTRTNGEKGGVDTTAK